MYLYVLNIYKDIVVNFYIKMIIKMIREKIQEICEKICQITVSLELLVSNRVIYRA